MCSGVRIRCHHDPTVPAKPDLEMPAAKLFIAVGIERHELQYRFLTKAFVDQPSRRGAVDTDGPSGPATVRTRLSPSAMIGRVHVFAHRISWTA